jgi:hypothetical protein
MSARRVVAMRLDCGAMLLLALDVDPAGCLNVGHRCPSPEELAATLWAHINLAELEPTTEE